MKWRAVILAIAAERSEGVILVILLGADAAA
jgi:hypothetical protein